MDPENNRVTLGVAGITALIFLTLIAVVAVIVAITSPKDLEGTLNGMAVLSVPLLEIIKGLRP